jgi:hypothetical protein
MKTLCCLIALASAMPLASGSTDEFFDHLRDSLSYSNADGSIRSRLSGTLDLEEYFFEAPAPQLLYAGQSPLFSPRLSLFVDTQFGSHVYSFVQARVDRGFDPGDGHLQARLDEYAVRISPGDQGRFQLQFGKFGAVIGNWIRRHGSWDDPFVTAPIPYTELTAVWDSVPAHSAGELLEWGHLEQPAYEEDEYGDKELRLPIIWGPGYAHGLSVAGRAGPFEYAVEMKSGSLSSRPSAWDAGQIDWKHPTFNAELSYHPGPMWNVGLSASSGPYLLPSATPGLAPGYGLARYRQIVIGQDFEFAWHHLQLWAEVFHSRFENPRFGHADVTAYYIEAKYKFAPRFSAALRWNQQLYGKVLAQGRGWTKWGRDTWRVDLAPTFRFSPNLQAKVQYSLQGNASQEQSRSHMVALQLTTRF